MDWSKVKALCHAAIMLLALIICLTCFVISLKVLKHLKDEDSKDGSVKNDNLIQTSPIDLTTKSSSNLNVTGDYNNFILDKKFSNNFYFCDSQDNNRVQNFFNI